jgi:hypothetical protein
MSGKATFSWAAYLNLDVQLTKDKHQVHRATKELCLGQPVKSVLRVCGNFKRTVHSGEGAQKCV